MPKYRITLPSGKQFEVTAPNHLTAFQQLIAQEGQGQQVNAATKQSAEVPWTLPEGAGATAADVAKSAGVGVGQAAIGAAGSFGDVQGLLGSAGRKLSEVTGIGDPAFAEQVTRNAIPFIGSTPLPSSSDIRGAVESITGPFYEPKSRLGEIGKTTGEFAANAAAPGGLVRRGLQVALPTAVKEGTRELTRNTSAEEWAPEVAGLVTSLGTAAVGARPSVGKIISKQKVPDIDEVRQMTKDAYDELRGMNIKYDANEWDRWRTDVVNDMRAEGFRPAQAPKAHDIINALDEHVSPDFADVESLRISAGNLAKDIAPTERAMGAILKRKLDKFTEQSPLMTLTGHTTPEIQAKMKAARELASRKIKGEQIEEMIGSSPGYLSGQESGLRNQFASMTRRLGKRRYKGGWSEPEKAAIAGVHAEPLSRRLLGTAGRGGIGMTSAGNRALLGPTLSGAGGTALGAMLAGPLGAAAGAVLSPAAASIAKAMAARGTQNAADRALKTTLAGRQAQATAQQQQRQNLVDMITRLGLSSILGTSDMRQGGLEGSIGGGDIPLARGGWRR